MTIVSVSVTYYDTISAINLFSAAESWAFDAANADDDDCVYDGIKKNVEVEAIAMAIFKFGS